MTRFHADMCIPKTKLTLRHVLMDANFAHAHKNPAYDGLTSILYTMNAVHARGPVFCEKSIRTFSDNMKDIVTGKKRLLIVGPCADTFEAMQSKVYVSQQTDLLHQITAAMPQDKEIIIAPRMVVQLEKPRSEMKKVNGQYPYLGDCSNGTTDKDLFESRLMVADMLARNVGHKLVNQQMITVSGLSRESLLLSRMIASMYPTNDGSRHFDGTSHLVWIGARTTEGIHMDLIKDLINPAAVKIGPDHSAEHMTKIITHMHDHNPDQVKGVILRLGTEAAEQQMVEKVEAVARMRDKGIQVYTMCDAFHGNILSMNGRKYRDVALCAKELGIYNRATEKTDQTFNVLLETTHNPHARECLGGGVTSLVGAAPIVDPCMTASQAVAMLEQASNYAAHKVYALT